MAGKAATRKRGRPSLPDAERRLASMGFRPTPELRRNLEAAAEEKQRSLSQEIEFRLEQSFQGEHSVASALEAMHEGFGSKRAYWKAQGLFALAHMLLGDDWDTDPEKWATAVGLWEGMVTNPTDAVVESLLQINPFDKDVDHSELETINLSPRARGMAMWKALPNILAQLNAVRETPDEE